MAFISRNNLISLTSVLSILILFPGSQAQALRSTKLAQASKTKAQPAKVDKADKNEKPADKKETTIKASPEVVIENVVPVSADQLVNKPQDFLNKNVKFSAKFSSFSSLALDYKPAMRSSKTYLSFLVFRPDSQIPLSELKLAMMIPKEKDAETKLLTELKEGDTVEVVGKVFSTALDDPWVDVLKIKKTASSQDDKKAAAKDDAKNAAEKKTDDQSGKK